MPRRSTTIPSKYLMFGDQQANTLRKREVKWQKFFKVHASPIHFMSRCCSTRISASQDPAVWGRKPLRYGSGFSLCPSPELWALGSPSVTAVSWFWSLVSRVAWKCSQGRECSRLPQWTSVSRGCCQPLGHLRPLSLVPRHYNKGVFFIWWSYEVKSKLAAQGMRAFGC